MSSRPDLGVSETLAEHASIYVHVPFCASKCAYCDFVSVAGSTPAEHRRFVDRVAEDLASWSEVLGQAGLPATSVYVGGGTPTLIGGELLRLMAVIGGAGAIGPEVGTTPSPVTGA